VTNYNPSDWYWQVTDVGVYGSARGGLVDAPSTDAAYLAWKAVNGPGNVMADAAALDAVLASIKLPASGLVPPTGAELLAYANGKVQTLLATSRPYDIAAAGGGSAATVNSDCTTATGADLLALNVWAGANSTATQPWVDDFGAVTVLTGAQFTELGLAVQAYGASVWAVMAAAATGIAAATITTTAEIDALSWPA
jgi:hypothetical protein